jgi:hypothetical protein
MKKITLEKLFRRLFIQAGHEDVPLANEGGSFEKAINAKIVIETDKTG